MSCPRCESDNVFYGDPEVDDDEITQDCQCHDCRCEWSESGVITWREPIIIVEPDLPVEEVKEERHIMALLEKRYGTANPPSIRDYWSQ